MTQFLQNLWTYLRSETDAPEPKEWSGPQCFDSVAGTTMVAIHIAEATPHRRLS